MLSGLVCDSCDAVSPLTALSCGACGEAFAILHRTQAPRTRTCAQCGNDVPNEHRFCGFCGAPTQESGAAPASRSFDETAVTEDRGMGGETISDTQYFGAADAVPRAKLVLIRGDGQDGVSYVLSGENHRIGRTEGDITFADDDLLSPLHANFYYRDGTLHVSDEGSHNGVFLRIKEPFALTSGQTFLIGEQLLEVVRPEKLTLPVKVNDGTFFYSAPYRQMRLQVTQQLVGGFLGARFLVDNDEITVGREGNAINFSDDPFLSARHAQLKLEGEDTIMLTDLSSKNGTFVRIADDTALPAGSFVFLGRQLFRVEDA